MHSEGLGAGWGVLVLFTSVVWFCPGLFWKQGAGKGCLPGGLILCLPSWILLTFLLSQAILDLGKDGWMSWKSWPISLKTLDCSREYWIQLLGWVIVQDRFSWSFWASMSSVSSIPGGTLRSTRKPLPSCWTGMHCFYVHCFSSAGTVKMNACSQNQSSCTTVRALPHLPLPLGHPWNTSVCAVCRVAIEENQLGRCSSDFSGFHFLMPKAFVCLK